MRVSACRSGHGRRGDRRLSLALQRLPAAAAPLGARRLADCAVALQQGAGRERPHGEEPDLEYLALEDLRQPAALAGGDADADPAGGGLAGAAGRTALLDAGDGDTAVRAEPGLGRVQRGAR